MRSSGCQGNARSLGLGSPVGFSFTEKQQWAQSCMRPTVPRPEGSGRLSTGRSLGLDRGFSSGPPAAWTAAWRARGDHMQLKFLTGEEGGICFGLVLPTFRCGSSLSPEGSAM